MARWQDFRQCPHCDLDLATGEGDRACAWGDCPYIPAELDVYCEVCRFNFFTMEGNPTCADPVSCEHAPEPLEHVENYRVWLGQRPAPQASTH